MPKILVAEDDPVAQVIIKKMLTAAGDYKVTIVGDGKEAIDQCVEQKFDLLLLDLNLPSIKGNKIISFMRTSQGLNSKTPAVLMSAHEKDDLMKIKGVSLANDVLTKPLDQGVLQSTLSKLIK